MAEDGSRTSTPKSQSNLLQRLDGLPSGKGLHRNESELQLRFGTSSFENLRYDQSLPLSVMVSLGASKNGQPFTKPVTVLGMTQKLNVDIKDLNSIACEWVEFGRSPLQLCWVEGSSEVEEILVVKARAAAFQGTVRC